MLDIVTLPMKKISGTRQVQEKNVCPIGDYFVPQLQMGFEDVGHLGQTFPSPADQSQADSNRIARRVKLFFLYTLSTKTETTWACRMFWAIVTGAGGNSLLQTWCRHHICTFQSDKVTESFYACGKVTTTPTSLYLPAFSLQCFLYVSLYPTISKENLGLRKFYWTFFSFYFSKISSKIKGCPVEDT